jgi:hypothetical protein
MIPSAETLLRIQRRWPFSLEALDTVLRLRLVLRSVSSDPLLSNRLALRTGGNPSLVVRISPFATDRTRRGPV